MITSLKKFNEQTARSNKDVQVSCIRVQPKKKKQKTVFFTSLPAITNWNIIFKMVQFHNSSKNYEVYENKSRIYKISMVKKKIALVK